jgi:hypothetical protein
VARFLWLQQRFFGLLPSRSGYDMVDVHLMILLKYANNEAFTYGAKQIFERAQYTF